MPVDADLFKALGDATRRTILDELTERDGQTLFELCGRLSMKHGLTSSRQAISQHLAVLEQAGLVHTPVDGDQPSLLIGLVARARLLGLEVVAAGKSTESDYVWDQAAGTLQAWGRSVPAPAE